MRKYTATIITVSILLLALATPCVWLAVANRQKRLDNALFEAAENGTGEDVRKAVEAGGRMEATAADIHPFAIPIPLIGENQSAHDLLLKAGLETDPHQPRFHYSPIPLIHWSIQNPNMDALKTLLAMGVPVNTPNTHNRAMDGVTCTWQPIHRAAEYGNVPAIQCLLDAGAKFDALDSRGKQPIHYAAESANAEAVKLFLALGAKADAADGKGCRPLHQIAFLPNKDASPIAALLISAGAKASAKNNAGQTPADVAKACGRSSDPQTAKVAAALAAYLEAAAAKESSPAPKN